ncbi:MAG: PQQ-binding-like beta-propeller repeat protein [Vicinamibacterales bacterium]|nr:PQQ-binding-like beta-propeller repeat protein [Vicinamibacterales bacterium]HJN46073.1 PQQ-binding-like beta-propeller repeat protein [Vicinamibacterales bacterium]
MIGTTMRHTVTCVLFGATLVWAGPVFGQTGAVDGEWRFYAGDGGHTQYTALDQIDRDNVDDLEVAWRWQAENSAERPFFNFETTPIMAGGTLYTTTGASEVAAIDAATGETTWLFTPPPKPGTEGEPRRRPQGSGRGVAYWTDGEQETVFHNVSDGRLLALDARTGQPRAGFGDGGFVDLSQDIDKPGAEVRCISTPIVSNDVVVAQVVPTGDSGYEATPGHIRGYDVRTGERLWIFHVVPQGDDFGVDTWENESWRYTGHTGVWTQLTVDEELGYLFLPTEIATNDWYGGHRPGDNLFAESIVCLDVRTGELIWHYQLIHHGIWDYDNPSPPTLIDVTHDGRRIKAVAMVTKQGYTYVFDRENGTPLWPIFEMRVPQSDVPGEQTSLTQPIPSRPAPFERQGFTVDDLIDFTPEIKAEAMEIVSNYRMGPLYTPPSLINDPDGTKGTLVLPGWGGGSSWPGAGVDVETGVLFVPSLTLPIVASLAPGDPGAGNFDYMRVGNIYPPGPRGLPLVKPPWGQITAIDLNTGDHLWQRPLGGAPRDVREHPDLQGLGLDFSSMGQNGRPGALVTRTLLFMGEGGGVRGGVASLFGAGGPAFRAYDKRTGDELAEIVLPANPTGSPMSYMLDGKQYIAVAAATLETPAEIIALALP